MYLEAACPGSDPFMWLSRVGDGMGISTSGLQKNAALPNQKAASFTFNQIHKEIPIDISPSIYPELSLEIWFQMNEAPHTGSRDGKKGACWHHSDSSAHLPATFTGTHCLSPPGRGWILGHDDGGKDREPGISILYAVHFV